VHEHDTEHTHDGVCASAVNDDIFGGGAQYDGNICFTNLSATQCNKLYYADNIDGDDNLPDIVDELNWFNYMTCEEYCATTEMPCTIFE
jgi:hypothetical protein